ncbi:MAG TPA: hypothetical protein VEK74_07175 [Burkholderiaceae bacterium]|nr:hypothetical protein [Burkholderiaceae bacterium]
MPYFAYRIEQRGPVRSLEAAGVFDDYRSAAHECRRLRAALTAASVCVKMIFADNVLRAEELLSEVRPAGPIVDEDY